MARLPHSTDFHVTVDGVGTFSFARRTLRDEVRIGAEFSRLTEGVDTPTPWLQITAGVMATLKILTVSGPDGWDIESFDPLDQDTYDKMILVHSALRAKEDSFRRGAGQGGKETGQGAVEEL